MKINLDFNTVSCASGGEGTKGVIFRNIPI